VLRLFPFGSTRNFAVMTGRRIARDEPALARRHPEPSILSKAMTFTTTAAEFPCAELIAEPGPWLSEPSP
jgi:hypothetical protein